MIKKKGLGRGLGVLFGDCSDTNSDQLNNTMIPNITNTKDTDGMSSIKSIDSKGFDVLELSLGELKPNEQQPRKYFDRVELDELKKSINLHGIISPLVVVKQSDKYLIVAGERRYRVSKELGLTSVPCIVKDYTPQQIREISLVDNIQRDDLSVVDIANYLQQLIDEFGYTQEVLAERMGVSRSQVSNIVRILSLTNQVKDMVNSKQLTYGHARCLVSIVDEDMQLQLANKCIEQGLSVRGLESLVKNHSNHKQSKMDTINQSKLLEEANSLTNRFRNIFETNVILRGTPNKGKIILEYSTKQDLDRFQVLIGLLEGL
jgi:ParB family chromosome partitioning protein